MLSIGSLCSGACDGLSLGLEWAGLSPVLWQVELEADRRANLARHWPDAERLADVRECGAHNLKPVDVIVCSSPCQDLSSAGKRAGLAGSRSGVWFECLRVIGELRPRFVVVENVASGAIHWVPYVRSGLGGLGYQSIPAPISAADCGAPQPRRRVFVVAHLDRDGLRDESGGAAGRTGRARPSLQQMARAHSYDEGQHDESQHAEVAVSSENDRRHSGWPTKFEVAPPSDGLSGQLGNRAATTKEIAWLGDSVVPHCGEVVGWIIRELAGIGDIDDP